MIAQRKWVILAAVGAVAAGMVFVGAQDTKPRGSASPTGRNAARKSEPTMTTMYSKSGYDVTSLPRERVAELAAKLAPEAYRITQKADTERPFCGNLLDNKLDGVYCCVVCGLPVFASEHKFKSGTGWPSFFREFDPAHVAREKDTSHDMVRTEINCARCAAHLGHVFDDGPAPTGQRHCVNSASLRFYEQAAERPPESRPVPTEVAYFAGGCFWGLEHYFQLGSGVLDAVSGYMQGGVEKPSYQDVCTDATGHAETVKVVFDPQRITYRRLLEAFFKMHDPTQLNRQGPDVGAQYRSGIWYANESQQREAEAYVAELRQGRLKGRTIATQVEPAKTFWPAEVHHQDYVAKTGRACHVKDPW